MTLILQMLPLLIIVVAVGIMLVKKNKGAKDKSSNNHPTNW